MEGQYVDAQGKGGVMNHRQSPADLKNTVTRLIDRELCRCEKAMGSRRWSEHKGWVQDYLVTGAKIWLVSQARSGEL